MAFLESIRSGETDPVAVVFIAALLALIAMMLVGYAPLGDTSPTGAVAGTFEETEDEPGNETNINETFNASEPPQNGT